jgi:hypothetical protein
LPDAPVREETGLLGGRGGAGSCSLTPDLGEMAGRAPAGWDEMLRIAGLRARFAMAFSMDLENA